MCGIAGIVWGCRVTGYRRVQAMVEAQKHRGPDDHGVEVVSPGEEGLMSVTLGSCRLAILDLSVAGHQPMKDPTTGNWIVHNGEIYNFRELRKNLEARGETFHSDSDTEVMLLSYKIWGRDAVQRWRGMFACGIWDAGRREVVLMRDRLGVKPLYWASVVNGGVVFGSEIRTLLASGLIDCCVDPAGVSSFLSYGAVRAPTTMIRQVRSLSPATCATISARGEVTVDSPYWDLTRCRVEDRCDPNATIKVRSALQDAVETHLVSDAPVGVFLSGGVDSSAIVALMSQVANVPVKTFSVVFEDLAYSEAAFSREVAKKWGTEHYELMLSEQRAEALIQQAVECMDQPSVDGVNSFIVSECAKQGGVKVALSGLGGDELFGGYSTFRRVPLLARAGDLAGRLPALTLGAMGRGLSQLAGIWRTAGRVSSLVENNGDILSSYLMLRALFPPESVTLLTGGVSDDGLERFKELDGRLRTKIQELSPFHQVSLLEMELYMGNTLLRDTDVMSMAHSLEVRVPFLDHLLIEYVWSLPSPLKWRAREPKRLLLAAMGRDLPIAVVSRPKMGFTFPWATWIRGRLGDPIEATFVGRSSLSDDMIDRQQCRRLWTKFVSGTDDHDWSRIWALYVLCRWLDRLHARKKPGK